MVKLVISRERLGEIFSHCIESYPYECCGLMIGEDNGAYRRVVEVVRAGNVHEGDRRVRYMVDPISYLNAERRAEEKGLRVVGIYHSHPNVAAVPSKYDLDNSFPYYLYLIVSVSENGVREYRVWMREENEKGPYFSEKQLEITAGD